MDTPKIKIVLFAGKVYKDGTHPIMIRITKDRRHIYKGIGFSVPKDAWDDDNKCVYEKEPKITKRQGGQLKFEKLQELSERYKNAVVLSNAKHINSQIEDTFKQVAAIHQKLQVNEELISLKTIKSKLNPEQKGDRNKSFTVFGNDFRDEFLKLNSIGSYKRYKSILHKLETYVAGKDLMFSDLTVEFLQNYQAYLTSLGNKVNTIHNNLKSIRAIYYAAIAEQIITAEKNPFFVFKLKADNKTKKEKLTVEEIIKLEKLKLEENTLLFHARNFFLFSFYCAGIRVSDVLQLKWRDISKEGRVEYRMDKTGTYKSIQLIPKAQAILKVYRPSKPILDSFIFPFINQDLDLLDSTLLFNQISSCTSLINKYLKEVATAAEIEKPLSTHIARHSFSDIARKRKASIYDISKMLGHSSIKITEAYLASFDIDSQDEAMKSIMDY